MPELPEVEAASQVLRTAAQGKSIVRLETIHPSLRRRLSRAECASVRGRRVMRVTRRGKHQILELDDGRVVVVHFRMTGDWHVARAGDEEPAYARAILELDDGTRVTLADLR